MGLDRLRSKKFIKLGSRFGRLEVISEVIVKGHPKRYFYLTRCDCGSVTEKMDYSLTYGKSASCGCLAKELLIKRSKIHGLTSHKLYDILAGMKARCYNPKVKNYHRYGGKGITICDEWMDPDTGVQNFYDWSLANGWYEGCGLSIDRFPDKDGPYSPENCRWATRKEQSKNLKNNVMVEWKGEISPLKDVFDRFGAEGLKYYTLKGRLKLGWGIKEAVLLRTGERRVKWD